MAIEANFLGLAVEPAGNALTSVTSLDMKKSNEVNPFVEKHIWGKTGLISNFIRYLSGDRSRETISILDLGCGSGAKLERMCQESSIPIKVSAIDLVTKNISSTKKRLEKLDVDTSMVLRGNITEDFPDGNFDLITAFEFIHWLKPEEVEELFQNISDSMNNKGRIVISYATRFNNALLRDEKGELDLSRSVRPRQAGNPICAYSYSSRTNMTFFSKKDLLLLAEKCDLRPFFYLETDNVFFPTCQELRIPLRSNMESRENAYMAFGKKK